MPNLTDASDPVLDSLPEEIRENVFNPAFVTESKSRVISVRLPDSSDRAMDIVIQQLRNEGGIPWIKTQSDIIRIGIKVILEIFNRILPNPNPELDTLLKTERMHSSALATQILMDTMEKVILSAGLEIQGMLRDGLHTEAVARINDLARTIDSLKSPVAKHRFKKMFDEHPIIASLRRV